MQKKKIQGTSAGVLPLARSWPMVRDCIPWTANRSLARRAIASATRSFVPSIVAAEAVTGSYPTHEC